LLLVVVVLVATLRARSLESELELMLLLLLARATDSWSRNWLDAARRAVRSGAGMEASKLPEFEEEEADMAPTNKPPTKAKDSRLFHLPTTVGTLQWPRSLLPFMMAYLL